MSFRLRGEFALVAVLTVLWATAAAHAAEGKVLIGLNAEVGHLTSTSDDAIRQGILLAIDEVNRGGGVLDDRQLELVVRDNRAVPARMIENNKEFAAMPDLVAVFCGKFSSAVIQSLPQIHELQLPLLDAWAANDKVIDNGFSPNYAFRLSLRDSWAVPTMLEYAHRRGWTRFGVLLINTSWGRNNLAVIQRFAEANPWVEITDTQWFNYGDQSLLEPYLALRRSGAQAVVLIAVEAEAAVLVRDLAALPEAERLPVVSHWSVAGGDFPALAGAALQQVELAFVQTFDLHTNAGEKVQRLLDQANRLFGIQKFSEVPSPVGLAHAYDLTRILALAIDRAGTTERSMVRDALETLPEYDGLIRQYQPPFSKQNHEALRLENVFMARYRGDGVIEKAP